MERSIILKEYFELRNYLNKSNKLANQKTEIQFEVEISESNETRIYCCVKHDKTHQRVILATRNEFRIWERAGFSRFKNFESYLALIANNAQIKFNTKNIYKLDTQELIDLKKEITESVNNLTQYLG